MTNGIVLLNLGDRNAAEFSRLEVPGSYDKALGALTAGTYINVYKWQYQGFALTASICTVEDMETYLLLKDKTNGGELKVYSDDTITIDIPVDDSSEFAVMLELSEYSSPGIDYQYGTVIGHEFSPADPSSLPANSPSPLTIPGFLSATSAVQGWLIEPNLGADIVYYSDGWQPLTSIVLSSGESIILKYRRNNT